MKALIVYYSETGNTKKLAHHIGEYLHEKGWAVDERWLQPKDEAKSFFGKCLKAFFRRRTEFESTFVVVSPYDLVCFGSPVWAMGPAPAMNTYLKECVGLMGKKVLLFVTYGSGLGKDACLSKMARMMWKKDVRKVYTLSIAGKEVNEADKIKEEIRKILV
jgi:flavodoxin